MYRFYMDESGIDTLPNDVHKIGFMDKWFTAGGIIVNDASIKYFKDAHDSIMQRYFFNNNIKIPITFKLHYSDLRQKRDPYSKLTDDERHSLTDEIFETIIKIRDYA